jgi:hypothetical protein
MAKLDAKQRAKLPAKDFGLPEKARSAEAKKESGNYPMPDEWHAISTKRFSQRSARKAISQRTSSSASTARRTRS